MASMWKRLEMIDRAAAGRKIVEWTLDPSTRPTTIAAFQKQMEGAMRVKDPSKTTKINFIDTPLDTILIRLPPAIIIQEAKDKYTDPATTVDDFPFPPYYHADTAKIKADGITAEELFFSSVGDYTTTECE